MADRTFISLIPRISPSVPGMPDPALLPYIRSSAIAVCERTQAWRYEQASIALTAGTYEYEYVVPAGAEVCGVMHSTIEGVKARWLTEDELHATYPKWPSEVVADRSAPQHLCQIDPDHFVVAPVPDAVKTYNVKMFLTLRPDLDSTAMDKIFFDELEDLIVHHVLQETLILPNKSWTDRELAQYHAKQLVFKIASRRAKANLGLGRGNLTAQMQSFG